MAPTLIGNPPLCDGEGDDKGYGNLYSQMAAKESHRMLDPLLGEPGGEMGVGVAVLTGGGDGDVRAEAGLLVAPVLGATFRTGLPGALLGFLPLEGWC